MASVASHADLLDVLHDLGEVLQVRPIRKDVLQRCLNLYALVYALSNSLSFYWFALFAHPAPSVPEIEEDLNLIRPPLQPYSNAPNSENNMVQNPQKRLRSLCFQVAGGLHCAAIRAVHSTLQAIAPSVNPWPLLRCPISVTEFPKQSHSRRRRPGVRSRSGHPGPLANVHAEYA